MISHDRLSTHPWLFHTRKKFLQAISEEFAELKLGELVLGDLPSVAALVLKCRYLGDFGVSY